jgi:hypothetical protein
MKCIFLCLAVLFGVASAGAAPVPACSTVPKTRDAVQSVFDNAWAGKREAIAGQIEDLRKIKQELDDRNDLWIGKSGSPRELLTIFAMTTRATTELIQDLTPFGGEVKSLTYSVISNEKDVAEIIDNYPGALNPLVPGNPGSSRRTAWSLSWLFSRLPAREPPSQ